MECLKILPRNPHQGTLRPLTRPSGTAKTSSGFSGYQRRYCNHYLCEKSSQEVLSCINACGSRYTYSQCPRSYRRRIHPRIRISTKPKTNVTKRNSTFYFLQHHFLTCPFTTVSTLPSSHHGRGAYYNRGIRVCTTL